MPPSRNERGPNSELRIFTPIGQLGRGFSEELFWETIESGVDAIIADGGSTDSGPGRLALAEPHVPRVELARDLALMTKACHTHNVPFLIGSTGGDGENHFVKLALEIVTETIKANGYRPMKVINIYSEIDKDVVRNKLKNGLISPCGGGVPDLVEKDIAGATRIVAQMGLEPYLKAMRENPDFDIILGGRAYDPSPYAAFCAFKGFDDLGISYAMGKLMECGGQCSVPKSKEALAIVRHDSFDFRALQPNVIATPTSVAAHFLYEKTRPDILHGPGGALLLDGATFEAVDERTVRIRNTKFEPEPKGEYTIKLEGACINGYQTILVGAYRDPILISQLDWIIDRITGYVRENIPFEFDLKVHTYGINGVMGPLEADKSIPKEVGLVVSARAATQPQAHQVANMTKFAFTHMPYPGQLATAGNFAWPFSPCDIDAGPIPEFCVYHLMHNVDPLEYFPIEVHNIHGSNTFVATSQPLNVSSKTVSKGKPAALPPAKKYYLTPEPAQGTCYLADIASVIRSKNSGPYELTMDVMFDNQETYQRVKNSGKLTREIVASLYELSDDKIVACLYWDPAMSFKVTIVRPIVSGHFGESDTHGSQQHVLLLYIKLPWERE